MCFLIFRDLRNEIKSFQIGKKKSGAMASAVLQRDTREGCNWPCRLAVLLSTAPWWIKRRRICHLCTQRAMLVYPTEFFYFFFLNNKHWKQIKNICFVDRISSSQLVAGSFQVVFINPFKSALEMFVYINHLYSFNLNNLNNQFWIIWTLYDQ